MLWSEKPANNSSNSDGNSSSNSSNSSSGNRSSGLSMNAPSSMRLGVAKALLQVLMVIKRPFVVSGKAAQAVIIRNCQGLNSKFQPYTHCHRALQRCSAVLTAAAQRIARRDGS
eukprot:8484-Heterococcus_DN1.PRE.2